jgi:signal transduction histidine kinase/ActR/RegA family two-component response regulator
VLPLTFETEQLGVAVFELPQGLEVYSLLREQIASAVKSVSLHREMLEQERLRSEAEHQQHLATERLKSLSLIAGGVAHDLNNALGPIVAFPEAIRHDIEHSIPPPAATDVIADLNAIQLAGQRAARTIRDLLDLGSPNAAPMAYFDVNRAIEHDLQTYEAMCQRAAGSRLVWEPHAKPLAVHASKSHLLRALSNLVLNAVDALVGTGTVTIRTLTRVLSEPLEGVERIEAGSYAVLEVHDTGAGILPEDLPRVLEPFFSTKQRATRAGSGLGLAIVHRIVKDAKGYVSIESQPSAGTTFSLYFPLDAEQVCPRSPPAPVPVGGQERILVLDDELVQLRTARRILERLGYTVTTTQSVLEALKLCEVTDGQPPFDLVIVDMVLPGQLDGVTTVEQMRQLCPDQRALMATGYAPEQMHISARQGTLPWLQKPYTLVELAAAVRSALDTGLVEPRRTG